jgi:dolichol-phosphate mannosyltransferase
MTDTTTQSNPQLSVVLPIYNEETNIPLLHQRLVATLEPLVETFELIFVDDGSTDASFERLSDLHQQDPRVRVIQFSRNFGHHIAITAGLDHAHGELVLMMDADLQDLPEEIPTLYHAMTPHIDVVYAIRANKQFSWHRRFLASRFRWVMRNWLDSPMEGGIFRLMRQRVVQHIRQCRETDRMLLGLVNWVGFTHKAVVVPHGARLHGDSKYNLRKQFQLAQHAITAFSTTPLQLASWLGGGLFLISSLGLIATWLHYALAQHPSPGWLPVSCLVVWVGSLQLICTGILGEYIGRIAKQSNQRPLYIVQQQLTPRDTE